MSLPPQTRPAQRYLSEQQPTEQQPTRTPRSKPSLAEQAPSPAELPEVARRLAKRYLPTPPTPRRAAEPLDGLISTILSQQNTAPITRRQFGGLKAAYPSWEMALADGPDGIETVLKAAGGGLSRIKANYIWNVLDQLETTRGELSLKDTRQMNDAEVRTLLESLPGVGMKTASCVLLFDLARPAMPVDTHILRITRRLEWLPAQWNAVKVERWYDEVLPATWAERYTFHVSAIRHGRETCKAQRPKCGECVLQELCPSAGVFLK
ncbi:endonuclease III domain-containing protein [Deinococcus psychrotolerans]|uniref:endonuclease III domain-containing protein n=1 Tax=Deinococcus psychrotolerans TaxID=2489213 RepID=UPI001F14A03F|nr:endonuclease III [Deinococcus psychrotolerans]